MSKIDYSKGKIYKIESHQGDKIYIGSTTKDKLCQRMAKHRGEYNYWKNGINNRYLTSFKIFEEYGLENCFITLIESYPCISRDELTSREGYYIKSLTCVNRNVAGRKKRL